MTAAFPLEFTLAHILVVEDDPGLQRLLVTNLEFEG